MENTTNEIKNKIEEIKRCVEDTSVENRHHVISEALNSGNGIIRRAAYKELKRFTDDTLKLALFLESSAREISPGVLVRFN